jgi:hypothetical protein
MALGLRTRRRSTPTNGTAFSVRRELTKLDPFSFFVLAGEPYGLDLLVVGTTGAFGIAVSSSDVSGSYRRDLKRARRGSKRARSAAGQTAVHTRIHPLVCLAGPQFDAKAQRGARVIPWGAVVREIAGRNRSVSNNQARRMAEALGHRTRSASSIA